MAVVHVSQLLHIHHIICLNQQLFLKERERHDLSLVSMGQQNQKNKSMHGNEIDVILVEKDMKIHRMKTQLKEIEAKFRTEKCDQKN